MRGDFEKERESTNTHVRLLLISDAFFVEGTFQLLDAMHISPRINAIDESGQYREFRNRSLGTSDGAAPDYQLRRNYLQPLCFVQGIE